MCIANLCKIVLNSVIISFLSLGITVLLWWFTFFFKFTFPSDQLILLICSLFCTYQVHSASRSKFSSSNVCYNFVSSYFLLDLNCAVVSCVTSVFCTVNVRSLLGLPLSKSSASWEAVRFKFFFCADLTCSSKNIPKRSTYFVPLKKYNMKTTTHIK